MNEMTHFISGMIMMGYLVAGVFFLRFWRDTRDRLFAMFSVAFFILALQRLGFSITDQPLERSTVWYVVRLVAFLIILLAIIDKNRSRKNSP